MSVQQAIAWVQAGQVLIMAGAATYANIKAWIQGQNPGLSEADLNAILDAVVAGATRHKALADADAGK